MLLENTVICNVDCIGCAREGAAAIRSSKRMPLEDLARMADLVQQLKMEKLFYLNLGEPFLSPTICQELPLLRAKNPDCWILVSTNGVLLNTDAKREAALNLSHILFSVHGISDEMSAKYMLQGSFEKAYAAMRAMAAYRDARGLTGRCWNGNIFCSTGTTIPGRSNAPSKWPGKSAWTSFRSGRRIIRSTACRGATILAG